MWLMLGAMAVAALQNWALMRLPDSKFWKATALTYLHRGEQMTIIERLEQIEKAVGLTGRGDEQPCVKQHYIPKADLDRIRAASDASNAYIAQHAAGIRWIIGANPDAQATILPKVSVLNGYYVKGVGYRINAIGNKRGRLWYIGRVDEISERDAKRIAAQIQFKWLDVKRTLIASGVHVWPKGYNAVYEAKKVLGLIGGVK